MITISILKGNKKYKVNGIETSGGEGNKQSNPSLHQDNYWPVFVLFVPLTTADEDEVPTRQNGQNRDVNANQQMTRKQYHTVKKSAQRSLHT